MFYIYDERWFEQQEGEPPVSACNTEPPRSPRSVTIALLREVSGCAIPQRFGPERSGSIPRAGSFSADVDSGPGRAEADISDARPSPSNPKAGELRTEPTGATA